MSMNRGGNFGNSVLSQSILAWPIFSIALVSYCARLTQCEQEYRIRNNNIYNKSNNDVCSGSNIRLECAPIAHITAAMALSVTVWFLTQ